MKDKNESPLDKAMRNLSSRESCFDVALYLLNHGCGNDKDRANLLCSACKHSKLDVVKELVEQHHVIPSGKYSTSYNITIQYTVCKYYAWKEEK